MCKEPVECVLSPAPERTQNPQTPQPLTGSTSAYCPSSAVFSPCRAVKLEGLEGWEVFKVTAGNGVSCPQGFLTSPLSCRALSLNAPLLLLAPPINPFHFLWISSLKASPMGIFCLFSHLILYFECMGKSMAADREGSS